MIFFKRELLLQDQATTPSEIIQLQRKDLERVNVMHWKSKLTHLCPTLRHPMNCSSLGSSIHLIFRARVLEWVAFPSPGDFSDPGIELGSPTLRADALRLSHQRIPCYALKGFRHHNTFLADCFCFEIVKEEHILHNHLNCDVKLKKNLRYTKRFTIQRNTE